MDVPNPKRQADSDRPPAVPRKLRPGPGLAPEVVSADQRCRLRQAMIGSIEKVGYEAITVRGLAERAGVSTRTFYRHFENKEACLGYVYEVSMAGLLRRIDQATVGLERDDALRGLVSAMMAGFADEPVEARIALIDAFSGGPAVRMRMEKVESTFESRAAHILRRPQWRAAVGRQLITGIVAGMMHVARKTAMANRVQELPGLSPAVAEWALSIASVDDLPRGPSLPQAGSPRASARLPRPPSEEDPFAGAAIDHDRERILRAVLRLAAAEGIGSLTVLRIRRYAGLSRKAFDREFADARSCFLEAIDWMVGLVSARAQRWADRDPRDAVHTRRLLLALSVQAARSSKYADLALVRISEVGRIGLLRRERLISLGATKLLNEADACGLVRTVDLEASVAGAWGVAQAEISAGNGSRLPESASLLAHFFEVGSTAPRG